MAQVTLTIGNNTQVVGCRDGEEARLEQLAAMLNARFPAAKQAAGLAGSNRALLYVALMLADELDEASTHAASVAPADTSALDRLADRLERLADALENDGPNA